ncbi:MAG: orotate phosphoribosyltransferase [Deltaproteobacteria bacterium]|nr:orotate phosphoribosyltransferase [Deltaproteobacteria bacterium]
MSEPWKTTLEEDRAALGALLRERSVRFGKFTLASGKESDFYVDCKQTMLTAEGHRLIGRLMLARVPESIRAVGGLTLGADPLASAVSCISALAGRPVDALIVRKEPKGHGTGQWVEHPGLPEGTEVVVVEDVITTGGSSLKAIERLRASGFVPRKVLALVDRQEGGREALEAEGVEVEALFCRSDLEEPSS